MTGGFESLLEWAQLSSVKWSNVLQDNQDSRQVINKIYLFSKLIMYLHTIHAQYNRDEVYLSKANKNNVSLFIITNRLKNISLHPCR